MGDIVVINNIEYFVHASTIWEVSVEYLVYFEK